MSTPFDRSLEARALMIARDEYASRHGRAGSPGYRAAWVQFRQRLRGGDDARGQSPALAGVTTNADVASVLNAAIERAILVDGASMATAQLFDPNVRALRLAAHSGFGREFVDFFQIVDDLTTSCGSALAARTPVWVADTTESPIYAGTPGLEVMLDAGTRGVASLPITSPTGDLIGVISTHHARPTRWTGKRQRELVRLAQSVGQLLNHLMR